jgi:hypothetical protein
MRCWYDGPIAFIINTIIIWVPVAGDANDSKVGVIVGDATYK